MSTTATSALSAQANSRLERWEETDDRAQRIFEHDDPDYLRADRGAVRDSVIAAAPVGDTDELIERRIQALVGLVAQLGVAHEAGSYITVASVINVARAAFPRAEGDDELIEIGVAGMLVMRNTEPQWYADHRAEFGDGVEESAALSYTFRPDPLAGDLEFRRGTVGARAHHAMVRQWASFPRDPSRDFGAFGRN